jgi:hypothetical protein
VVASGEATSGDMNSLAWAALCAGRLTAESIETAQNAVKMGKVQKFGPLQTLAAVYAEIDKTTEAHETMLRGMEVGSQLEPDSESWYVFGRIAEQYGLNEVTVADSTTHAYISRSGRSNWPAAPGALHSDGSLPSPAGTSFRFVCSARSACSCNQLRAARSSPRPAHEWRRYLVLSVAIQRAGSPRLKDEAGQPSRILSDAGWLSRSQSGRTSASAAMPKTGHQRFSVPGHGIGVPDMALPRIFDRFCRADAFRSYEGRYRTSDREVDLRLQPLKAIGSERQGMRYGRANSVFSGA